MLRARQAVRGRRPRAPTRTSRRSCKQPVLDAFNDLRGRFDVVVCEGAGSPAEINLRAGDLANMGLARAADLPVLLVGDIDRGGVFPALFGTRRAARARGPGADRRLPDQQVPRRPDASSQPGLDTLQRPHRPPHARRPALARRAVHRRRGLARDPAPPRPRRGTLDVVVIRLRWMSNFTDVDALAAEPGVSVRYSRSPADVERADLVVLPGTKATVEDLQRLRADGLDQALQAAPRARSSASAAATRCSATAIEDGIESADSVDRASSCCR